jgi:hypothetical protein
MAKRGQSSGAWVSRFIDGSCPIHGLGLVVVDADVDDNPVVGNAVRCVHEECSFVARRFPGRDAYHHRFAWTGGPDEIRAALRKANVIDDDGVPTRFVKEARTSYPLGDDDVG